MTLSSADLRCNKIIFIISKINKQDLSDKNIQKCHNMAGASYKIVIIEIIVSGPLVKVIDHTETKEVHTTIPCILIKEIQASMVIWFS